MYIGHTSLAAELQIEDHNSKTATITITVNGFIGPFESEAEGLHAASRNKIY